MRRGISPSTQDRWLRGNTISEQTAVAYEPAQAQDFPEILSDKIKDNIILKLQERIDALQKLADGEGQRIWVKDVIQATCDYYHITSTEIKSRRRNRSTVRPRQVCMYLTKVLTSHSLPEIGRRFGDFDHTTVLHAIRAVERLMATDEQIAADVVKIKNNITAKCAA